MWNGITFTKLVLPSQLNRVSQTATWAAFPPDAFRLAKEAQSRSMVCFNTKHICIYAPFLWSLLLCIVHGQQALTVESFPAFGNSWSEVACLFDGARPWRILHGTLWAAGSLAKRIGRICWFSMIFRGMNYVCRVWIYDTWYRQVCRWFVLVGSCRYGMVCTIVYRMFHSRYSR